MASTAVALPTTSTLPTKGAGASVAEIYNKTKKKLAATQAKVEELLGDTPTRLKRSAMITGAVGVSAFTVPLLLEAFPRIKAFDLGPVKIETQAMLAGVLTLVGGGVHAVTGSEAAEAVFFAGLGTGAGWLNSKGAAIGQALYNRRSGGATPYTGTTAEQP